MTKDEVIEKLWQIIDDIDTASDLCKDNDKCYRNLVEKYQKSRWNLPITCNGYGNIIINTNELK